MPEAPVTLVDSHCHIDMPEFDHDRVAVVERAREAGVSEMLIVGGFDEGLGHRRALAVGQELGLPVSAGIHPHEARIATEVLLDELRGLGRDGRIVAVGEVGLDFHYDHSPREIQLDVFRLQVRLAREVGLPLIVHTREADLETALVLEEEGAREIGGVIHCFTGSAELARRALDLGFFISFSGIVTFPRSDGIQEVARTMPIDRLLIETDAPFLAPPPHRGKRNEPAFVLEVARKVAALRGAALHDIGEASRRNFHRLFGRRTGGEPFPTEA